MQPTLFSGQQIFVDIRDRMCSSTGAALWGDTAINPYFDGLVVLQRRGRKHAAQRVARDPDDHVAVARACVSGSLAAVQCLHHLLPSSMTCSLCLLRVTLRCGIQTAVQHIQNCQL